MSGAEINRLKYPAHYAKIYFWGIFVLGFFSFLFALLNLHEGTLSSKITGDLIFFVILNVFAELAITRIPVGGALTASFSIILTILLVFGPIYATISAIIGATISTMLTERKHWSISFFNSGLFSIIFVTAGLAIKYIKGTFYLSDDNVFSIFIMAFTVTIIYIIMSSVIVNTYITLSTGINLKRLIKEDRWEFVQLVILAPISVLGVYFYYSIGIYATLAAFFPAIVTVYAIKNYMNMNESNSNLKALNENLEKLYEITKKISIQTRLKELWLVISSETSNLIPYDRCLIYLINPTDSTLILESGDLLYAPQESHDLLEDGPLQNCIAKRITVVNNNFSSPDSYGPTWKAFKSILAQPIISGGEVKGIICLLAKKEETFSFNHLKFLKLLLSSVENTIKNINLYEQTQKQALIDGLTGLYNQKYFKSQIDSELRRADVHKYETSLIMLDVDYFKKFNDTHGHLLGDLVLKDAAFIVKSFIKNKNTYLASRYGGEEFAILLPETSNQDACILAENIRKKVIETKFTGREQTEVNLTISSGVYTHLNKFGQITKEDFIDRADTALYRAKNEGRNQVYSSEYSLENEQLIIKNYSNREKNVDDNVNTLYAFAFDSQFCKYWINAFEKFDKWFISEDNIHSKELNNQYIKFFTNIIIKKIQLPEKKLSVILNDEKTEEYIFSNLKFPTDFYNFEIDIEELEKAYFDYIATLKTSEIEKEHIRKLIIGIFNKVYTIALKFTSNHYQSIIDYHTNIAHINSEIGSISKVNTFYSNIAKLTSEILNVKYSFIAEIDSSKRFFNIKSFYGISELHFTERIKNAEFKVDNLVNMLITYADTLQVTKDEFPETFIADFEKLNIEFAILIPLIQKNKQVSGMIVCLNDQNKELANEEIKIAKEIAKRVVTAISRIQKTLSEKDSYLEMIKSMIDIFEAKSPVTKEHSKNVSRFAGRIASALGIPKEGQIEVRTAAYLHDIGKVGFTDDKLNNDELLKSHPLIGARILNNVEDLKKLSPIVKHHHENWDGSGYPDGLEGKNIPIYSRILSIANNYDNYLKTSKTPQEAIDNMLKSNLFDPEICNLIKTKVINS